MPAMARRMTATPQAFMGAQDHQPWQDHRGGGGQDKNSWLLTPDIGSASTDVLKCPISLKTRFLHLGVLRWTNPNGGQMVVRPIAT
jgi:hypothetical protein